MTGKKTAEMDRWLEEKIRRCGRRSWRRRKSTGKVAPVSKKASISLIWFCTSAMEVATP